MKKIISIFAITLMACTSTFAQVTPIAYSEVNGIQTTTPWFLKFNTEHSAQNLVQNDLIAVFVGKAILPSGDTIVSADSLIFDSGLQIPHVMQIDVSTENTTVEFFVETKVVDTVGGIYDVIQTHSSVPFSGTTAFLNGVPASWGHSFIDVNSGGVTLLVDSLDGQNGTWFSVIQQSGPGGMIVQPIYIVGVQYDVEFQITNCQPSTAYGVRLRGDAGGGIVLFTSGILQFTTSPITGPLVYVNPVDSSSTHLEAEITVIGNGSNTPFTVTFDGLPVYNGSTSDTFVVVLPSNGLNFSTQYTWGVTATNGGGSASTTLEMMTTGLDDLSIGVVSHVMIAPLYLTAALTIPTFSDGGPSDVIVHHPNSGMTYSATPGTVSVGYDTTYVDIPLLTPGITEDVIIQMNRGADGATQSWTYYIVMDEAGVVSITVVEPNIPLSNSHIIDLELVSSMNVGGVGAEVLFERQDQQSWVNAGTQSLYDASGTLNHTLNPTGLISSTNYRYTIPGKDTLSPHSDNVVVVSFTTGPVPNDPTVQMVTPIDWNAPDWIANVQMNFNTMTASQTGNTGYLRASNNPANLTSPLSNVDQVTLSAGWTQNVTMFVDIEPYMQAGDDTLYYVGYVLNAEGGWSYTQQWAVALPELDPGPDPIGPVEFLGSQVTSFDSIAALIQLGLDLNGVSGVTATCNWFTLTGPSGSVGPQPINSQNGNFLLTGLPDNTEVFYGFDIYVDGVYENTFELWSFTTLASPAPVDPSGIEEIVAQDPLIAGDVYNILGSKLSEGVLLRDLQMHTVSFGNQILFWRKGDLTVKVGSH